SITLPDGRTMPLPARGPTTQSAAAQDQTTQHHASGHEAA
ncbi:MAG: hypothetical protein JWN62_3449, partial [Acidimicrobiales bacterium]|nr:hypothetical protein [Acidimicrobiales bacterium]